MYSSPTDFSHTKSHAQCSIVYNFDLPRIVSDSQQNLNVLRGLATQLQRIVNQENQKCWGKPLGSPSLWNENVQTIQRIQAIATEIKIEEPGADISPKLHQLPEECIREIILRIADYRDLESSSGAWATMKTVVAEQRIWRELARFHFKPHQIDVVVKKRIKATTAENAIRKASSDMNNDADDDDVPEINADWQKIFHDLRRYI